MRGMLVFAHRWIGLFIAVFVALTGVTGSVLAWRPALEAAINPGLFVVHQTDAQLLDPLVLRERVERHRPDAQVVYLPLHAEPGRSVTVFVQPRPGATPSGNFNDEVFVDPYTGVVLGERRWGDIGQGRKNLLPFIYRLHYALAAGDWGAWFLGWVAVAWTLDCFIGFALTLPVRRTHTGHGWGRAWLVRWGHSTYKLNFDLHRASGLWLWPLLFVFAWSSVALNLPGIYDTAMRGVFRHQAAAPSGSPHIPTGPALDWEAARGYARAHAAQQSTRHGFEVIAEHSLAYDGGQQMFVYDIRTTLDVQEERGNTRFLIDARDGALHHLWRPSGAATGDTVREWFVALHTAAVFGIPYKLIVTASGIAIAVLCFTGVYIWWRKWRARRFQQRRLDLHC